MGKKLPALATPFPAEELHRSGTFVWVADLNASETPIIGSPDDEPDEAAMFAPDELAEAN